MFFDNLLAKYINIINSYIINFSIAIQSVCIFLLDCINFEIDNKLNCMKKFAKISFLIFVCLFAVALVFVGGIFVYINTAKSNVTFDKAKLVAQNTSIDIFDTENNKINKDTGKKAVINIEELPDYDVAMYTHKKMKTNSENSLEVLRELQEILKDWSREHCI